MADQPVQFWRSALQLALDCIHSDPSSLEIMDGVAFDVQKFVDEYLKAPPAEDAHDTGATQGEDMPS